MSYFVAGILRIVLLEASAALLLVERLFAPRRARVAAATAAIAALSLLAFANFGQLRGRGMIHEWEQYHFFFGSKYLREIGYFDLYKATLLADRESAHALDGIDRIRDLHNFEVIPVARALADAPRVRAAFSDRRWEDFKRDWTAMSRRPAPWRSVLTDHGNSASPAWALFAMPIASLLPLSPVGQHVMAFLDFFLMALLFANVLRAFGVRAGCVALTIWSLVPFCFDYLAGSFLRWDWLFAVGMSVCSYRRDRFARAGAFLSYAVASKLFPVFFAVALAGRVAVGLWCRRRIEPRHLRFAAFALAVGLSSNRPVTI